MPRRVALSFSSEDFLDTLRLPLDFRERVEDFLERLEPLISPNAIPDSEEEAEPLLKLKKPPFSFLLCCSLLLSWYDPNGDLLPLRRDLGSENPNISPSPGLWLLELDRLRYRRSPWRRDT
jgi:hypothetical protein